MKLDGKWVIGRRERVDLPDLGLMHIPSKVDTGAYSCAIHAEAIKVEEEDGKKTLKALLIGHNWEGFHGDWQRFEQWEQREIKNSFGQSEVRFVIKTRVSLFGESFRVDFTLSDRKKMTYPILLGRRLLKKGFLVDVEQVDVSKNYLEKS